MSPLNLPPETLAILKDKRLRRLATQRDHTLFFHTYLAEHVMYPTAPFQLELLKLSQDPDPKYLVVEAFRGSAKSTIMALSLPIWSIVGVQRKKFVLILCQTQAQAALTLKNIKDELTDNRPLRAELGPFTEPADEWRQYSIVIPKYGARITAVSLDTAVRGMKHRAFRPDLIIADDLEDLASVKVKENRDKLFRFFFGDLVPMGDINTKVVIIGTRLHDDGIIMRLREKIESNELSGVFRSYPLVDDQGRIAWVSKFPDMAAIEALRKTVPSLQAWSREYLLRILDDEESVVKRDWIHRYSGEVPSIDDPNFYMSLIGVDLAITEHDKGDCTAAVSMSLFRNRDGQWKVYVHPYPVNQHMLFPPARKLLKDLSRFVGKGRPVPLYIEAVQYQAAMPQDLRHEGLPAEPFKVHGQDKRQRLTVITHLIQEGIILFPEHGCEELLSQLINFGAERHDDLADAFAIAAHIVMEKITAPGFTIPPLPAMPEKVDEEATRQNDLWLADRKLEYQQGRITFPQWCDFQDQHRQRKRALLAAEKKAQDEQFKKDEDRRMKQHLKQQYDDLMRKRRGY